MFTIHRLHFAGLVLLQPELLDNYASAMVQAAKEEPDGLGFIPEKTALEGDFRLAQSERVTDQAQEKLLLIATVEELLRHEIGLKEITDQDVHLVFPSRKYSEIMWLPEVSSQVRPWMPGRAPQYFRIVTPSQFTKERPDAPNIPGKRVLFSFEGPLNNIYATLAVRLSQSLLFKRDAMWQNVAYYTASDGGGCGIHLLELEEGRGELALFYDEQTTTTVRTQFEAYVGEHLRLRAIPGTVMRRVIRACAACGYVLPDDLVQLRLGRGATTIRCPACDETIISLQEPSAAIAAHVVVAEMNRSADTRRDQDITATRLKGQGYGQSRFSCSAGV